MPRQRQFRADLVVVNDCLDELIALAKRTQQPEDIEALQTRDYSKASALHTRQVPKTNPHTKNMHERTQQPEHRGPTDARRLQGETK